MAQLIPIAEYCKRCHAAKPDATTRTPAQYRVHDKDGEPVEDVCRRHGTVALDEQLQKEAGQVALPVGAPAAEADK